jgi:carboxyl-terminal processing protease
MKKAIAAMCCCGIAVATMGCGGLTAAQRDLNIASFDHVWETVRDRHFDADFNGVDWDAMRAEYRPQIVEAKDMDTARGAMGAMLGCLGQSHFGIIPAAAYASIDNDKGGSEDADPSSPGSDPDSKDDSEDGGNIGVDLRVLDGQAVVTAVYSDSAAALAGVKRGWVVQAIDDREVQDAIETIDDAYADSTLRDLIVVRAISRRFRGPVGQSVDVRFLDTADAPVQLELKRSARRGKPTRLMNMPEQFVWIDHHRVEGDVGYVRFNGFFHPSYLMGEFSTAMTGFMDAAGVIIDLRGNPGGIGALSMGMAGWLIPEKDQYLGTMSTRSNELRFVVFPRAVTFDGPVAVLIDGLSASTSEIFAGGLRDLGRARLFGSTTAGAALPSVIERLPNGDGFQYAIANYISGGGAMLEGDGVTPHDSVQLTRQGLIDGKDDVVQAALKWIRTQ